MKIGRIRRSTEERESKQTGLTGNKEKVEKEMNQCLEKLMENGKG